MYIEKLEFCLLHWCGTHFIFVPLKFLFCKLLEPGAQCEAAILLRFPTMIFLPFTVLFNTLAG